MFAPVVFDEAKMRSGTVLGKIGAVLSDYGGRFGHQVIDRKENGGLAAPVGPFRVCQTDRQMYFISR